ncbi:MAG: hypothetical protein ABIH72_01535 [archaeon]
MKLKSLVLFSGGLDSRLAAMIMQAQSQVILFHVKLPFSQKDNTKEIKNFARKQNFQLITKDFTKGKNFQDYLNLIRKPKYKRGSSLNPCIDCHAFIIKLAKKYADKNNIKIIATGEVLGERPLSQHKKALLLVEQEAGLTGRLLRPLSAKLLEETEAEKKGLIDRNKLLDIEGRKRNKQIALALKYNMSYPQPAGGCLLCEKDFVKKLKPFLKDNLKFQDIELLKIGRHFHNSEIILGKNQAENESLEKLPGIKLIPIQPGPTAFIKRKELEIEARRLIQKYSKHKIKGFKVIN